MMPRSEGQTPYSRLVPAGFRRRGEDRGFPDNPRRSWGVGNLGDPARLRAAILRPPSHLQSSRERKTEGGPDMGEWVHQDQIDETVGWFVRTALPDAQPGWEDLPWSVDEMGKTDDHGRWWTIAVDVPTSVEGMDCWLSFRVVEPGGEIRESFVKDVHAVRSGRGEHEFDTYVCDDGEGMWVTPPDDDCDE